MTKQTIPPIRPMEITLGGKIPIEDIVGREETVERLWDEVARSSLLMNDIRRLGKTTTLRLMEDRAPDGWLCIRTTVEAARSTSMLVEKTFQDMLRHAGLKEQIGGTILSFMKKTNVKLNLAVLDLELAPDFQERAWQVFRTVLEGLNKELEKEKKHLLIVWDEFPSAIRAIARKEGPEAAKDILALFRALREDDNSNRVRWILTGSVGFHHVLRFVGGHGTEMIDLTRFDIGTIAPEWSDWMMQCLLVNIDRPGTPEQITRISEAAGGIPYLLMMMAKYMASNPVQMPETKEEAVDLLISATADSAMRDNWTPLVMRIMDYYEGLRDTAEAILDAVARTNMKLAEIVEFTARNLTPAPGKRDIEDTLELLIADRYLCYHRESGTYAWLYEPLRTIWQTLRRAEE